MNSDIESGLLAESAGQPLIPDQPISDLDQDNLGRGEFASGLAKVLKNYRDDSCLVVGLYAPWGAGKSSLLNLLANELAKEPESSDSSPIVIRFNPWNFSSLDSLLSMFFLELQVGAGRSESKLAKSLQKSLKALSVILAVGELSPVGWRQFNLLSRWSKKGSDALENKTETLFELKNRINRDLRKLNRRIFVLIDDIDRLDQQSMRFMFRLIRLNADFDGMTYVLAFDRDVVSTVLTQEQGVAGSDYLEKIVQVGFDIPPAEPEKISRLFSQSLDSLGYLKDSSEENLIRWIDLRAGGLDKLIRTPRDVVRYVNGLAVNGGIVLDEVNPIDLVGIEAIRTFAPELYSFIRDNRDIMVGTTGGTFRMDEPSTKEMYKKQLDEAYSVCKPDLLAALKEMCSLLFPEVDNLSGGGSFGSGYYAMWRRSRRICTVDYFPRYFYLRPSNREVSQAEFDVIMRDAGNRAQLRSRLDELADTGKLDNFLKLLGDTAPDVPEENIKPAVLALFDTGDKLEVTSLTDNQLLAASGVVNRLLTPLNEQARLSILLKAAESSDSLGAMAYFTSLYGKDSEMEKKLMNDSGWNDVRQKLVARINTAAEEMSLARSPHLAILLYRWSEWAPTEDSRRFARRLTESDDGVLEFLQGMVARTSSTVGRYASRNGWYLSIDGVKEFIDPEVLVEPLQRMKSDRWAEMTDFQREAIDAFFAARSNPHENT